MRNSVSALALTLAATLAALCGCESTALRPSPPSPTASEGVPPPSSSHVTVAGGETTGPATTPATLPALPHLTAGGAVSPEMLAALQQLSAEDYQTRQDAVANLQQAMAKQFQQMILVQELMLKVQESLANQLRQMTLSPELEEQARVASLMEFNNSLSRWAIDVLALPPKKREAMMQWGLEPKHLPLIAKAYARRDEVRAKAAKEIAQLEGEIPMWFLGQLLNDSDREVSLSTMDALWDKTPTPEMVDILFNKVIAYPMQNFRPRPNQSKNITIRGRVITIYANQNQSQQMQDADVAADLLIKMKNPLVREKLVGLFTELTTAMKNPNDYSWRMLSTNYGGDASKSVGRLIEAYKPPEAVVFVMKTLDNNRQQDGYNNNINNVQYRYSSRIDMVGLLVKMTNQDPDDYKLKKIANYGDRWMIKGQEKEEEEMLVQVQDWWREHWKEYGGEEPPKAKAKPAVDKPAPGKPVVGRRAAEPAPGKAVIKDLKKGEEGEAEDNEAALKAAEEKLAQIEKEKAAAKNNADDAAAALKKEKEAAKKAEMEKREAELKERQKKAAATQP